MLLEFTSSKKSDTLNSYQLNLSLWFNPLVVLSMIQAVMMIYALVASRSIFGRERKDFRERALPLDTTVMENCGYDDPEKWKEAKSRAKEALKQYIRYWKKLLITWGGLYLILVFTSWLNLNNRHLGWSYAANIIVTLLNNFNSLFIVLSFIVLNNPTIQEGKSNNSPVQFIKSIEKWGTRGILIIALIEFLTVFCFEYRLIIPIKESWTIFISDVVSGLVGGVSLTLYFGRLQNKFLGLSLWLPVLLSLYAVIQPLFLLIKGIGVDEWTVVLAILIIETALILKCLLYMFVVWLFESGRLLFYFVRVKPIHESVDSDWIKFHSLLE